MHARSLIPFGFLALLAPVAVAWAGGGPQDPAIDGEASIRVVDDAHLQQCLAQLAKQFPAVAVLDTVPGRNIHLLGYSLNGRQSDDTFLQALTVLQAKQTILWGELNYGAQTAEGKTDSLWVSYSGIGGSQYESQYAWSVIGLSAAHDRTTGYGTVVAVLDTGIDASHPALAGRVLPLGYSVVGKLPATVEVADSIDVDGDGNPAEMFGHGTFVAGLIAGVAPDAKLLAVRVLDDDGYGDLYRITKAMFWAIDQKVDVINMSLGSTYKGAGMEEAAIEAWSAGIAVVGAAGNLNLEKPREYPACDSHAIGVAATDELDLKAPFSNYNDKLALSAPGDTKFLPNGEADPTKSMISAIPGGGWATWEGTSLSTALVSGTLALVRAQHPEWPNTSVPIDQVVDQTLWALASTAEPLNGNNPQYEDLLGVGRISAGAAAALGPIQPKPGDIDLNGVVGASDIAVLLGAWGQCVGCAADLNHDGMVNAMDLSILLGLWD
ncbi:MAG: S8 family serine peptidase [Phycisphaerae bacterium]|jgi:subtilisin family serine protease|nr:S8 family serine peptidase [Phycisphaerae bacterium]